VSSSGGNSAESDAAGAPDQEDDSGKAGSPRHAAGATGETGGAAVGSGAGEGGAGASSDDAGAGGAAQVAGSGAGAGGASLPVDVVPPTILSITPVNGATQLTPLTDVIVITFSEPMNKASAQSAFVPSGVAPAATFSWNEAATELTINPNLTYPAATDPAATAEPFKFSVTTAAKDLAGNSLAANVNWQFTLLRQVTQSFGFSSGGNWTPGHPAGNYPGAGDTSFDVATRGFITYDISGLPSEVVLFESATISTIIVGIEGDPFGLFGNMLIQSISYPYLNQAAFDAPPLHDLGVFITATGQNAANDLVSKDVLVALKDDYANRIDRKDRSQYKLVLPSSPNSDATQQFAYVSGNRNTNKLIVTYLFP
jgi:Bacterial Ig-like domain